MFDAEELYKMANFTLTKWNIPYDEDLVQELVLKAYIELSKYDESKGAKSTYIVHVMQNRIKEINRNNSRKGRNTQCLSLDNVNDDGLEFSNLIPADCDIADYINKKDILEQIEPLIDLPLKMQLNGVRQDEIARRLNTSQENVSQRIRNNIKRIREYVNKKGLMI